MRNARTLWVQDFNGLHDEAFPGAQPTITPDLRNVKFRFGQVLGRGGLTKYRSISTASATTPIIGLFSYRKVAGTNYLVRMTPTALHVLNTGTDVWDVVTGTALTGTSTTRPQYTLIDDTLVFTNEGEDLPRKYTASGNSANIASGTSPYAKAVEAYVGFLMLGNVSTDGTFTDVVDGHRIIRFSDDWDNSWTACDGNEITLDETPGNLLAMKVLGRDLICYKDDGLVKLTWVGGNLKFTQSKIPFALGCASPLSVQSVGELGHIFLGTDGALYMVSTNGVHQLGKGNLNQTLPTTFSLAKLKYARAMVDEEEGVYCLFYDRTGLAGQALDSYVSYNYRTQEFSKGRVGYTLYACEAHKPLSTSEVDLVIAGTDLVKEFDAGANDDGTNVERYVTTGWQSLSEQGKFLGARIAIKKSGTGRIKVSVARDMEQSFKFEQTFSLKGNLSGDAYCDLHYRVPPIPGEWFNVKVRFFHDAATTTTALQRVGLEILPTAGVAARAGREGEGSKL